MKTDTLDDLKLGLDADWMRSDITRGLELEHGGPMIDRENRIIRGFAVVSKGEAKGHDVLLDDTFLNQVLAQGKASKHGVKMRFDHPNASNTSIGSALGRAKNFRRVGDTVRADAFLLESAMTAPNGNLAGYVMDLAEEDPGMFGASIAFKPDKEEYQKDKDGKPDKQKPPYARLKQLLAADIVDDPAANPDGMFAHDSLAEKATAFMNRWAEHDLKPLLHVYFDNLKEALMSEAIVISDEQKKEFRAEGIKAERERVKKIHEAFTSVWGEKADAVDMKHCDKLIELGIPADQAEQEFKVRKLRMMSAEAPQSAGGAKDTAAPVKVDLSTLPPAERYQKEWDTSAALREEFGGGIEEYKAFRKAEDAGLTDGGFKGTGKKVGQSA